MTDKKKSLTDLQFIQRQNPFSKAQKHELASAKKQ